MFIPPTTLTLTLTLIFSGCATTARHPKVAGSSNAPNARGTGEAGGAGGTTSQPDPQSQRRRPTFADRKARFADHTKTLLEKFDLSNPRIDIAELFSPGVDIDGIPALSNPEKWNIGEASYPSDDGRVIVVNINDHAVAYPLGILSDHEIVNDVVGGTPVAITYCPLCDSVSVFDRRLKTKDGKIITPEFGVSGMLCRSNLLMYDRITMGLWSQADMGALTGPFSGQRLSFLPTRVITYGKFKKQFPEGQVLSTLTGYDREYPENDEGLQQYFASKQLYMPVEHGQTLPPKTLGMGILSGNPQNPYAAFISAEQARQGPVQISTPQGIVTVAATNAGMQLLEAPTGVETMQCFYFAWSAFHPETSVYGDRTAIPLLDGKEKSIVVVGYSTSYAWPDMLQEMLNEHSEGERTYSILNAVIGGSPIERWIGNPGTRNYDPTMGAMLHDYFDPNATLRGDAPEPTIAICQQSLQFTRTQRGPIPSANDEEGIRIGRDAILKHGQMLHELGLNRVYIAMHIYKKPIEPEVGNERIALREALKEGHAWLYPGPDVWTITRNAYPECFEEDRLHPNETGMKLMAEHWYRTLAGSAARQDIIDRLHARSYDINPMMRAYIQKRRRISKQD